MIKIVNENKGITIEFDNQKYMINEKDLGAAPATHATIKGIDQVGTYLTNSTIGSREIAIVGYCLANSKEEMKERKRTLYQALNPLDKFTLYVDDYKIECVSEDTVSFAISHGENNHLFAKFMISAFCPNPCFTPINATTKPLSMIQGLFHFPLILTTAGVPFGVRQQGVNINVVNNGDIATGMIITFKARGPVVNPSLMNVETREVIKIKKSMVSGETIIVNTNYGKKSCVSIVEDETTNILNYWDIDNTFIQLAVGDNWLKCDADSGADKLDVDVSFAPQLIGV